MIIVNAKLETNSSNISKIKSEVKLIEKETLLEEGCQDYAFSVELNNPNVIRITEKWDNQKALEAHFTTPHMIRFQSVLSDNPIDKITAFFYEAKEVSPQGLDTEAFE